MAAQLKGRNRILEVGAGDRPFLTKYPGTYKTMDVDTVRSTISIQLKKSTRISTQC